MTSGTRTRGRPRDQERTAAILAAANEVLHDRGWEDLTVGDIAKAAGCGLATIYRRWETKEELVAAAIRAKPAPPTIETGDPSLDLHTLLTDMARDVQAKGEGLMGFLAATTGDPDLRAAFEEGVMVEARPRIGRYLAAVVGADSPHIELLIDGIAGALVLRAGMLHTLSAPEAFADETLALVEALAVATTEA